MKLYLICEDVDLGYHVYGVFTDKTVAETQRKLAKFGDYVEVVPDGKDLGESPDDYVKYLLNKYDT